MSAALTVVALPLSLVILGAIALAIMAGLLLGSLFGPLPRYRITGGETLPPSDSEAFLCLLEALADAKANRSGSFEVLPNGPSFYPAALTAIRAARHSVNLEAYIFSASNIGRQYVEALAERARAGVQVHVTLDAFGTLALRQSFFRPLLDAGGQVSRYNRLTWYRLLRYDNRTHRELLIVDGTIGFIGGAGIADEWLGGAHGQPQWRDTVVRVTGEPVRSLQATFAENWLSTAGELLVGDRYFPSLSDTGPPAAALVVNSTPTPGGGTRARVLFELLIASARHTISITSPYFLPDKGLTGELCRAITRGVRVRILVPGRKDDHLLTRSTSRGGYGPLLRAGASIFEYQPAMIHAKILTVDSLWSVVGSTNFDNRSFGINDEVNLALRDPALATRLEHDTAADLEHSRHISLAQWQRRPVLERAPELLGWLFERQQ